MRWILVLSVACGCGGAPFAMVSREPVDAGAAQEGGSATVDSGMTVEAAMRDAGNDVGVDVGVLVLDAGADIVDVADGDGAVCTPIPIVGSGQSVCDEMLTGFPAIVVVVVGCTAPDPVDICPLNICRNGPATRPMPPECRCLETLTCACLQAGNVCDAPDASPPSTTWVGCVSKPDVAWGAGEMGSIPVPQCK